MKWLRWIGVLFVGAVILLGGSSLGNADEAKTIRITNGEWVPYLGENLPNYGIVSQVITEAFADSGVKVQYGFFPWPRAIGLAQYGEWDAAAVWFRSPEREAKFYVSDTVIDSTYVFFHLKSYHFIWKTLNDLKGIEIGGTQGYSYREFSEANKSGKIKISWARSDEINYRLLLDGRIKIFPNDKIVGYEMIARLFTPKEAELFTHSPIPLRVDPLCLLFSKKVPKNKELVSIFNAALAKLKKSGRYDQIIQQGLKSKRP